MTFDLAFLAAMIPAVILMGLAKGGFAGLGVIETYGGRRMPGRYVNGNLGLRLGGRFWLAG